MTVPQLKTLEIVLSDAIADVRLNRPERSNALNEAMWHELRQAMQWADATSAVRIVVISGTGRNFCSGIDLSLLASVRSLVAHPDPAHSHEKLRRLILDMQDCLSSIERCRKPVIAAIHGVCLGAGVDLATCCDMRYGAADSIFSVREIDLALVADVGTLQRLPRLVPDGVARELAFTGRSVEAEEAREIGLLNRVFESADALAENVREIAGAVAEKSPLAIRGTKEMLNYSRDHSVADGLNYVATWNAAMMMSVDLGEAMAANCEERPPVFED